uniref:Uncharacterized protein n=1 Tax=Ixodes ricinus TaxID=34613 RepID=A0A6B0UIF3_IXORI
MPDWASQCGLRPRFGMLSLTLTRAMCLAWIITQTSFSLSESESGDFHRSIWRIFFLGVALGFGAGCSVSDMHEQSVPSDRSFCTFGWARSTCVCGIPMLWT